MPLCPRCGKHLSSEQAVTYHLNKKYKCGTWKCRLCNKSLSTKFDLNIHLLSNCNEYKIATNTEMSRCNDVLVCQYKDNNDVLHVSTNALALIGYSVDEAVGNNIRRNVDENGDINYTHRNGNIIKFKRVFFNNKISIDLKI